MFFFGYLGFPLSSKPLFLARSEVPHTQPARKQRSQNRDKTYEAYYRKYFKNTYDEIHKESKNDEVRQVYVIWAVDYDKEISAAGAFFHKPLAECLDTAVNLVFLNVKKTDGLKSWMLELEPSIWESSFLNSVTLTPTFSISRK